ncbi:MAG: PilZ domain-containing protein [Methylobacter sp.]|uniref:PilZ domain-containing protein n=1 Tax=Methylobacter sp. TaxID=2051955 RepID=UPI00272F6390|nr:PilZ domain-containing protein [Methylobacter sp.]MDP1664449.1 PilZ domain-containing protein [Methylobacter sp.]MDP1970351.1 PilZ domain-containing protein [Methylobacter sp.]
MERRLYQRIPVQVSAIVTTEDGVRIKVIAVDVSSDGLGVECNIKQRNMITPGGSFVRDGKPVSVFVDLNLSDGNGQLFKIVARCHVVFSRRMSSDQCKIGLRYADIENNNHKWLIRFIEKRLVSD